MDVIEQVSELLSGADRDDRHFPATDLFNEGWMLRLVLHWFDRHRDLDYDLSFSEGANWYSEALLPSAFLPRHRGDHLAESWTHADGVIGHFSIGENGQGDLSLRPNARQLVVTEAKMFSKLSRGVTNARYFNQAARNVACIAEIIYGGNVRPADLSSVGFYVIAPKARIDEGVFAQAMDLSDMRVVVGKRVSEYEDSEKQQWLEECFEPLLDVISLRTIAWEEVLDVVSNHTPDEGALLQEFYARCMKFNQFVGRRYG